MDGLTTLEDLAAVHRRNAAASEPFYQEHLRLYVGSLVNAYGYRADYDGPSFPRRVPYVPLPFAEEMVGYFQIQAKHYLEKSLPENIKQPRLIRHRMGEAERIVGDTASYEDAPPAVAAKAPDLYHPDIPAGRPHPKCLKASAAWRLFDALVRLARHFDSLSGAPTKADIFVDSLGESAEELGEKALGVAEDVGQWTLDALSKAPDAARAVLRAPGQVLKAGKDILTIAAVVGVGILALWAVKR